jgi:hypothetical protein
VTLRDMALAATAMLDGETLAAASAAASSPS